MDRGDNRTCVITDWRVFAPGVHKETAEYFSPADTAKFAANFRRFPHIPVTGKLGHDRQQRYRESLGLPAVARVVSMHTDPDGEVVFDRVDGIPRIVGSAIASGFLPGVSIELAPRGKPGKRIIRDPDNPAAPIDGDILTGFAFLGEELPAVPGYETPTPTFDDGTPVPPLTSSEVRWWLEKMAPFLTGAGNSPGQDERTSDEDSFAGWSVAFSALTFTPARMNSVDPQTIIAALQADPNLLAQVLAAVQPAPDAVPPADAAAAPPPAFSASPEYKAFAAELEGIKKENADLKKCMGALEEKETAREKEKEESVMSATARRVEEFVTSKDVACRVPFVERDDLRTVGLDILTRRQFSSADEREKHFSAWKDRTLAKPVNPALLDTAADTTPRGKPALTNPVLAEAARKGGVLDRLSPALAAGYRN